MSIKTRLEEYGFDVAKLRRGVAMVTLLTVTAAGGAVFTNWSTVKQTVASTIQGISGGANAGQPGQPGVGGTTNTTAGTTDPNSPSSQAATGANPPAGNTVNSTAGQPPQAGQQPQQQAPVQSVQTSGNQPAQGAQQTQASSTPPATTNADPATASTLPKSSALAPAVTTSAKLLDAATLSTLPASSALRPAMLKGAVQIKDARGRLADKGADFAVLSGTRLVIGGQTIQVAKVVSPQPEQKTRSGRFTCRLPGQGGDYDCGTSSREWLRDVVGDAEVSCAVIGTDVDGASIASCSTDTVPDIGRQMVSIGWAMAASDDATKAYVPDQQGAISKRAGMWAGSFNQEQ